MHKKAVALVLSMAIINLNSYETISYAAQYINENTQNQEQKVEQNTETSHQEKEINTQNNTHDVHNTEELNNAINIAVEGDIINIHPGEYSNSNLKLQKSGITLQGCSENGQPVTDKRDAIYFGSDLVINADNVTVTGLEVKKLGIGERANVSNVTIKNCYITVNLDIANNYTATTNNITAENLTVSGSVYVGFGGGTASNTTIKNVKASSIYASNFDTANVDNTIIDGCEVKYNIEMSGRNNELKNTSALIIHLGTSYTEVDNCDTMSFYIGYDGHVANTVTVKNTRISRNLAIGSEDQQAENIYIDNVSMDTLYVGNQNGTTNHVTINNSTISGYAGIGRYERGRAKNTTITNSKIEMLSIGVAGGIAENTRIRTTDIKGNITIANEESKATNTFIQLQTNNTISDNGTNTVILNTISSNETKLTGHLSQGLRVVISRDNEELINKVVGADNKVDFYFKEDDPYFTLDAGDRVMIRVFDSQDTLVEHDSMIVEKSTIKPSSPTVNEINNKSTNIIGKSVKYLTVIAKQNGIELGRSQVDSDGNFEITLGTPLKEYSTVQVYAIDKDQNISDEVSVEVMDRIAPGAPVINEVTTKSKTITGTAEPNTMVQVSVTSGKSKEYFDGYTNGEGNFIVELDKLVRKDDIIEVCVYDMANNRSDTVTVSNIIEILPTKPTISQKITNASSTIKGIADSGCEVQAYINGKKAMTSTTDSKGNYTLDIPWVDEYNVRIPAGTEIEIVAVDKDGDKSKTSKLVVEDVRPNPVEKIDTITNKSTSVSGKADPNKEVIIFIDKKEVGRATSNKEGQFKIILTKKITEDTKVEFVVSGENNILSEIKSTTVKDVIAPTIEYVSELNNREKILAGRAEPNTKVIALREGQEESDSSVISTTVSSDGSFNLYFDNLTKGEIIRVYAKDKAGNKSEIVEVTVKNRLEPYLSVGMVQNIDNKITGHTVPGSQVMALLRVDNVVDGKQIGSAIAKEDGSFTIELSEKLNYQDKVLIRVVDEDGNINSMEMVVDDITAPYFIEVNEINNLTNKITGKTSEPGSKVKAQYLDKKGKFISDLGIAEVDKEGNFKIEVSKKLQTSYQVKLIAYDVAGNKREETIIVGYKKEFNDINTHWAKEQIYSFIDKGYISGYPDNTFKPDNQITRAEFVKIVNKVFGYRDTGKIKFTDVPRNEWYYDEVSIAVKAGYINGRSETQFAPTAPITRQEAAKIIATIKNCKDDKFDKINSFKDKNTVASWAKPYVEGVIEAGYMNGYSDNTFKPEQRITRAEAVVTLQRTLK